MHPFLACFEVEWSCLNPFRDAYQACMIHRRRHAGPACGHGAGRSARNVCVPRQEAPGQARTVRARSVMKLASKRAKYSSDTTMSACQ